MLCICSYNKAQKKIQRKFKTSRFVDIYRSTQNGLGIRWYFLYKFSIWDPQGNSVASGNIWGIIW